MKTQLILAMLASLAVQAAPTGRVGAVSKRSTHRKCHPKQHGTVYDHTAFGSTSATIAKTNVHQDHSYQADAAVTHPAPFVPDTSSPPIAAPAPAPAVSPAKTYESIHEPAQPVQSPQPAPSPQAEQYVTPTQSISPAHSPSPVPEQQTVSSTPGGGDIQYYDIENCATGCPSQHIVEPKSTKVNEQRFGFTLNKDKLNPILTKLFGEGIVEKTLVQLRKVNGFNYNTDNPDPIAKERQEAGTYLALSVAAKFKLVSPASFATEKDAATKYAQLKVAGIKNDLVMVKSLIPDMQGLTVEQVAYLFGTNEHQNLHAILFGNPKIRDAVHATSLNDKVGVEVGDSQDQTPPNTLGGYNDKGTHPQWGWFEAAKGYNELVVPGN